MAAWDNAPVVDEAQPAWASAPTVEQPAPSTQDTIQNALGLAQEVYLRSVAPGFAFVPDVLKQGLISPETATKAVSYLPPVKLAELAFGKEKAAPGERMAGEILSGFTSPENIALMATPGIAAKLGTGIKFSELLRPSTLREIAFGKPTQPMMTPEEVGKSLGRTWRSTKEVPDASKVTGAESQIERNVRTRVGEETPLRQQGKTPPAQAQETTSRGQGAVAPQAKEVNPEAIKAPAVKDKFGKVIPLQPGEIHATVMTAGDTAGYITNSGEFLNFEQAAERAKTLPPTPIPTPLAPKPKPVPAIGAAVRTPDGKIFIAQTHALAADHAYEAGYTDAQIKASDVGFLDQNRNFVGGYMSAYGQFVPMQSGGAESLGQRVFGETPVPPVPKAEGATTSSFRTPDTSMQEDEAISKTLGVPKQRTETWPAWWKRVQETQPSVKIQTALEEHIPDPNRRAFSLEFTPTKTGELSMRIVKPVLEAEGATTAEPTTQPKGITLGQTELTAAYSGQKNLTIRAHDATGKQIGYVDFVEYNGEPSISMIEVDPKFRRQGIATQLLSRIQSEYPDQPIDIMGNFATKEGQGFIESWRNRPTIQPKIISTAVRSGDQILRGQTLNESHDAIAAREAVTGVSGGTYQYHVTTADRLPSISENGLTLNAPRAIGGPAYDAYSRNKLFFTSDEGVDFWKTRAEQFIEHNFDNYDQKGIAPVVLRVKHTGQFLPDEIATTDAGSPSSYSASDIPSNEIEVWNGKKWQSVSKAKVDVSKSFDSEGYLNSNAKLSNPKFTPAPIPTLPESQRGFIIREPDGTERFTNDRGEAARIAKAAGQVKPENAGTTELHSQELAPTGSETSVSWDAMSREQRWDFLKENVDPADLALRRKELYSSTLRPLSEQQWPEWLKNRLPKIERAKTAPAAGEGVSAVPQPKEAAETPPTPPTEPPSPPPLPEPEKPFSITSIKNAQVDQERIARGLPSATETGRKTFGDAWDQATAKIDADPNYVDTLLNELRGKPRALNDTEDAALLHRQVDLQNQFAKAAEEVNRAAATGDEGLMAENKVRLSALSDQLLDLYNIGKTSGTETARGLAMRKALAAEDFSLANMMTQERASLGGKPLTPEQEAGVRARHEKIRSAQIAYDAYETSPRAEAYRRRLRSLVEQYKAGTPPERGRRLTPDREMLQLKADLEQAKTEHWQSLQKNRMAQRSGFDKARDTFAKWRRAFVLSSPNTLAKLTSAAVERLTFTPTEEAIGGLISKIPGISEVARRAPIEGGFSAKAEARALTEGFTQGMKDSWSLLKGGRSAIDIQYGPQHVLPKEAVDFVGQVHGALKTVPRQAAFERAFQKLAEAGIAKGEDVTDPLIQTRYGIEAYKEANREIFLQNNRLISLYRQMLARLEAPDKETGLVPLSSRVASTAARVFFPIVKVPTNIVAETMQYATGTVTGSLRLANAFRRGIETLKPEQAELIMRDLKKGSLGSTVMLLGYLNADKVGGYYQKGQRRSPQDVKAGHIKVFGVDIPTYLIHNPLLETLQIGATIRRVAESKLRKKDVAPQGTGAGFLAGALGLTEEVPFVREMFDSFPKLFTATERPQFLGEFAKGLFIPQAVQWAALQLDKRNGDPVKRDAQTFLQHLQSGIPGLRQNVPEKRPRSGVTQPFAQ